MARMDKVRKLWEMVTDFFGTRTVEGPVLYFQLVYARLQLERLARLLRLRTQNSTAEISGREFVIKNRVGHFAVNPQNDSFTKSLPNFESTSQGWLAAPQVKNILLDIGANIGFYSLLALNSYGYQQAYAFEPNPETFLRLRKNFSLNKLETKARALPFGLGNENGKTTLAIKSVHTGASSMAETAGRNFDASVEVEVRTFDSYATEESLDAKRISFIKIDVEGYEYEALLGMRQTLNELRPNTYIMIEIHPSSPKSKETRDLLNAAGFRQIRATPTHNFLYRKAV